MHDNPYNAPGIRQRALSVDELDKKYHTPTENAVTKESEPDPSYVIDEDDNTIGTTVKTEDSSNELEQLRKENAILKDKLLKAYEGIINLGIGELLL